ncbi:DUF2567 domain-containing protein [Actinoalloteichus sp. AHMU CJ021]|nr:DUF2567 domain-containing protein [Actinoalloteichus sp. AHMU CJ021]
MRVSRQPRSTGDVGPAHLPAVPPPGAGHVVAMPARRPRPPLVRPDLLPALNLLSLVALTGLPLGWLWSALAPPVRLRVLADGRLASLPAESYHRFDALALFVLLGLGAGVVTGFAAWSWRSRRGPVVLVAVVLGCLAAAWLANRIGTSFAMSRFPLADTVSAGATLVRPPELTTALALVAQPLGAALSYGMAVAWSGTDDLGRRRG